MSLIGEALKRARLEAERRQGEERGTVYTSAPAYTPPRRRPRAALLGGLAVGGLVVGLLAAVGAFWLLRERDGSASTVARERAAAPPPSAVAAPPASPTEAEPATPVPPPIPVEAPLTTSPPAPSVAPSAISAEIQSAAPPPGPPPAPALEAGRTYSRVVELPEGKRLELDGIVASPTDPLAMINRRLLTPGEVIDGCTLVRIEPKRVELRAADGTTFFLSLR